MTADKPGTSSTKPRLPRKLGPLQLHAPNGATSRSGPLGGLLIPRPLAVVIIRMFAEFETGVRSYWRTIRPRARTPVESLLARVGDRCEIPLDVIQDAQTVREYRNQLVHDRDEQVKAVTIADARHRLATYFARLPIKWGV